MHQGYHKIADSRGMSDNCAVLRTPPGDGWTPGQHALLRAVIGVWLAIALAGALPDNALALAAAALAVLYATSWRETWIVAPLALLLALFGLQPADPSLIALGAALVLRAHRLTLEWCWGLIGASLAWTGALHWQAGNDTLASAEGLFLLLILTRSARPWIWLLLFAAQLALIILGRGLLIETAPLLLLLTAFDPAWIRPRAGPLPLTVYYDGECGFCHRSVRFLLQEDRSGLTFRYAPLQGRSFAAAVPEAQRAGLPDSIVVREPDGALLARSAAALRIGAALGGLWRPLAALARLVPPPLRDAVYDGIASVRGRLFRKPEGLCPLLPPDWMKRFDAD